MTELQHLELFRIRDNNGISLGGNQDWYTETWRQRAGCGPTNAANLLWYLSRTRPGLRALCPADADTKEGFLRLMDTTWDYVTPGSKGVNTTEIFTGGVRRYALDRAIGLTCDVLEVPCQVAGRPGKADMLTFIEAALTRDLPVAFLNLSNGSLQNLDNWHWVMLVAVDVSAGRAVMYDQGKEVFLDMAQWLKTTVLGGGFVVAIPKEA